MAVSYDKKLAVTSTAHSQPRNHNWTFYVEFELPFVLPVKTHLTHDILSSKHLIVLM